MTKKRGYYLCPIKQGATPFHIWGDLVEKAGLKMSEIPKDWDGIWNYLKQTQAPLRAKGMRKIYACGLQITTVGPNDGNNLFVHFLIANGGEGIVTPDGKLHTDDPKVREAAIKSVEFMTNLYKEGVVPPEALSWNDADDNNGFHEKLFVMDFDGTLSTELAMIKDKQAFYHDMQTLAPPNKNDGTPMKTQVNAGGGYHPEGCEERRGRQGLHEVLHAAEGDEREPEGRSGPLGAGDPADRQGRPVLAQHRDAVPEALRHGGRARIRPLPVYEGLHPAWGQVERRAALGPGACRCHQERHEAGRRGRQGVQAGRRDLREDRDRKSWRGEHERNTAGNCRRTGRRCAARCGDAPGAAGCRARNYAWAIAFAVPYIAVFLAFVVYPIAYGLWMGSDPALYSELFADPRYLTTVVNTLLYVGIGVNLKMFLAFLLSGFFMRKRLVDQGAAGDLHPALGDAGAARLHVDPLDAERPVGHAQQRAVHAVRHRRPGLAE